MALNGNVRLLYVYVNVFVSSFPQGPRIPSHRGETDDGPIMSHTINVFNSFRHKLVR